MNRPSKLVTAARIVLGLLFVLSGLNHLFALVPMPPMSGRTALFWQGLAGTGYFFPLLGVVEAVAGALLLGGRMVPLALVMIAPIALQATAFHLALAPQGLPVMVLVLAAGLFLAWRHRAAFAPVLRPRLAAGTAGVRAAELGLGLVFVASGLAGLLGRTPPPSTPGAAVMMQGLAAAGYFLPLLGLVQLVGGLALLTRRFVGLALLVTAPLVVQIAAYRLWVATPGMLVVAAAVVAAQVWLAFAHRALWEPLFAGRGGQSMRAVPQGRVSAAG